MKQYDHGTEKNSINNRELNMAHFIHAKTSRHSAVAPSHQPYLAMLATSIGSMAGRLDVMYS